MENYKEDFFKINLEKIEVTTNNSKDYFFHNKPVELIDFHPCKMQFKEKFLNYLSYIADTNVEGVTVKNIIGFYEESNQSFLVIDKVNEEDCLTNHFRSFSFQKKLSIVRKIAETVELFHVKRNLSLDNISTTNVYLIEGSVMLCVNNLKRVIKECQIGENRANKSLFYNYLCPEALETPYDDRVGIPKEGNIWSYGCVLSELFSNIVPWTNKYKQNDVILLKVLVKKIEFPIPEKLQKVNHNIAKIVEDCMKIKFQERITIEEVNGRLLKVCSEKSKIYQMTLMFNKKRELRGLAKKNILAELYKFF